MYCNVMYVCNRVSIFVHCKTLHKITFAWMNGRDVTWKRARNGTRIFFMDNSKKSMSKEKLYNTDVGGQVSRRWLEHIVSDMPITAAHTYTAACKSSSPSAALAGWACGGQAKSCHKSTFMGARTHICMNAAHEFLRHEILTFTILNFQVWISLCYKTDINDNPVASVCMYVWMYVCMYVCMY